MSAAAASGQYLTFFVGDEQFAAAAADIAEVFRRPRITRVPNGPPSLLGLAGLRGAPAPVVSLARLLGRDEQISAASRLLLLAGEQVIGLAVDRVGALAALPAETDAAAQGRRAGFGRLYQVEDATLRLLDLEALLRRDFASVDLAARPRVAVSAPAQTAAETEVGDQVALLGFELAGQAYALPLEEVAEAIALPPQLAAIAQSDAAVLGVARSHDRLLPIVSTRRLLGLEPSVRATDRVVVARIGEARVGLTVDRLQAIVRAPARSIDPAPAVLNRGEGEAQVQAICRLPGQAGLVAILSGERLFRDEKVAHILADGRGGDEAMGEAGDGAEARGGVGEPFLIFRLGDEEYGLPLGFVTEVTRLPERLTRVPKAPGFIEGVLNLRGQVTPIIDQRARLGARPGDGAARPRVVVTTVEGRQAGFIVDAVSEILSLSPSQIGATPELTAEAGRLFSRVATLDEGARLILLIEPKEMLDRAERDLLASLDASVAAAET